MSIKNQVTLLISLLLVTTVLVISSIAIWSINQKGIRDVTEYKEQSINQAKQDLKGFLEVAYTAVERNYYALDDEFFMEKYFGNSLRSNVDLVETIIDEKIALARIGVLSKFEAQREVLQLIKSLRYDNGTGYFWVTDNSSNPYVIMHPINPTLDGESLTHPDIEQFFPDGNNTIIDAIKQCNKNGDAIFEYNWDKPTAFGIIPDVEKVGYAREIPEWDWVCITGIYKDDARKDIINNLVNELRNMRFNDGKSYFLITNDSLPNPRMVMHAKWKQLEGRVMDESILTNITSETDNIFKAQVEKCKTSETSDCFLEYQIDIQDSLTVTVNKLTYSKYFKPLGWVISTGIDTGIIDANVSQKEKEIASQVNQIILLIAIISIIILALGIGASLYFSKQLISTVIEVKDRLRALADGKNVEKLSIERKDELGEMIQSLDALVEGVHSYTSFAKEIGKGNLNKPFTPRSQDDVLGNELLNMRNSLKKNTEIEHIRNWSNEGANIISDILHENVSTKAELSQKYLKTIISYLKLNQGAVFILNDEQKDDPYLEMKACYAYERRKFLRKKVRPGDGLLGQCFLEKDTIFLKEIPEEHVSIRSGLGDAPPRNILIIPLISNNKIYGVLEVASFRALEDYEVEFVEKSGATFASTLSAVIITEQTQGLLEHSQKMTEQLRSQEEELRQNQEEMQATQEEIERRHKELFEENQALKDQLAVAKQIATQ
ncbi:cache domain-containing protein [Flammeovirgaceae bacterium SG7u.111]|nr:cache domain-containing protein [Flammeovirgaceae bacterium SG7u.132]WPO35602.1 cache domain-containing protein [Flammeovirgaceae bacterium SG7u.111]